MTGIQEILILFLVIVVLSATGLWPHVMQALRELRGQASGGPGATAGFSPDESDLCYKILGLSPSATWKEIERAYRAKAKIHHPDKGGDEDAMRMLNDVYAMLKRSRRG